MQFPGNHGGVNWGGTSFNPQLGYLFVNTNELGQMSGLKDRDPTARPGRRSGDGQGNRVDPGRPVSRACRAADASASAGADDPQQLPCQQPPWGQLTAVNVNTGEFAWRVPLGVTDSLPPDKQKTGRPGQRRHDRHRRRAGLRRRDRRRPLPRVRREDRQGAVDVQAAGGGAGDADDLSQAQDGRQYVVITSTGGGFFGNPVTDDSIMAFALPANK